MTTPLKNESFHIVKARFRATKPHRLPRPFCDSTMGPFVTTGMATLCLRDADGVEGEAPAGNSANLETLLLPRLFGNRRRSYRDLFHSMYWAIRNAGFRGSASGSLASIDLALHDLAAKRAGQPLHRFLGAKRDWAAAYGSGGGTNLTERELVNEMVGFVERGFSCLKMKVGTNHGTQMDEDVKRVRAVRSAIGPEIRLAVDANQTWSAKDAVRFAKRIADLNIAWFEEPVHSADLVAIRDYCKAAPVPAAMGESERCGKVFPSLVEAGVIHLQPGVGIVSEWIETRELARAHRLAFSSGGYSQLTCQFVATAPESALTEILLPIIGEHDAFFSRCPRLEKGRFILDQQPGLGIEVDWKRLATKNLVARDMGWTRSDFASKQFHV